MTYAILILSQVAVGSAALLARLGLAAGLSAVSMTAWRLLLASAILVAAKSFRRSRADETFLSIPIALRLIAGGAALAGHFWAWFASLQYVSVARSTLLVCTTPIWTALALWILKRSAPPLRFYAGLLPSLLGAALVTGWSTTSSAGATAYLGDGLATGGAVLLTAYFLLTADLQEPLSTFRVVLWTYTTAAIVMTPVALALGNAAAFWPSNAQAWLAVGGMALIPQLLGHTMMNWSLKHFSAATVGLATLLEPVFAGALAWWFLGEQLTASQLLGGVLLLFGIAIVLTGARSRSSSSGT